MTDKRTMSVIARWISRAPLLIVSISFTGYSVNHVAAEVLISEIMYNPDGSDSGREWVELYNSGTTAVDLSGWQVEDLQDGQVSSSLPAGTMLPAGEALVVTGSSAMFDAQWNSGGQTVPRVQVGNFPPLANSPTLLNETVAIRNSAGIILDQVNYQDMAGWPRDSPDGASISLLPGHLSSAANDQGPAWIGSMGGLYGARYEYGPDASDGDRASPGFVETVPQQAFVPSPDAAWSMVVLPDSQAYVKSSVDKAIFSQMTQWIVDQRDAFGVQFVVHEGDIVNQNSQVVPRSGDQSGDQQWQNAKASMSLLDGVVPYAISTGNHDYGTGNAQDRSTQYNDFFTQSDNPLVDPQQGGTLRSVMVPGDLDNALHEFIAPDGREMLVVATEWGPRQVAVDWAKRALRPTKYAHHTAILLTHAYMYHDETRYDWNRNQDADPNNDQGGNPHSYLTAPDTHDGQELWDELVSPNGAIEMVLGGHVGGDGTGYLVSQGSQNQTVHQMLFNTQFETYGGNGWLRVLEFLDDGRTVRVSTYSPFHDLQKTDQANAFELTISPLNPGDYNGDGTIDSGDYTIWRDSLGQAVLNWSGADGNGDGFVDTSDYQVWRNAYSSAQSSGVTAGHVDDAVVPEPSILGLLTVALATFLSYSRKPILARSA